MIHRPHPPPVDSMIRSHEVRGRSWKDGTTTTSVGTSSVPGCCQRMRLKKRNHTGNERMKTRSPAIQSFDHVSLTVSTIGSIILE